LSTVIGVGNPDRGDDAAGLAVADRLASRRLAGVEVVESAGEAASLLAAWAGRERVVVVDATSGAGPPGSIHRFDAGRSPLPVSVRHASTHSFGLATAIELARALNQLPPRLVVYGIEGRAFEPGAPLSPEVHRAVDDLAARLLREVDGDGIQAP